MEDLIKVKVRDTEDILFAVKKAPSKYIEGEEYILVKKWSVDDNPKYIKRSSLIFHWR